MQLPEQSETDLKAFRESDAGKALAGKVLSEFSRAKNARLRTQRQWYENMAMFFGNQSVNFDIIKTPQGDSILPVRPKVPKYREAKPINKTRGIVRTEMAKLLSQKPTTIVVPSTSEDEDFRMAIAAEQTFEAYSSKRKLTDHMAKAVWWSSVTGNGFLKTWWDDGCLDPHSGQQGDIKYGSVTPFHLFVPDLLEQDIEDQPFVIQAIVKPVDWVNRVYGSVLEGTSVKPSANSTNDIMETSYLNLDSSSAANPDSVTIYELWVKPGGLPSLPEGGFIQMIDNQIVQYSDKGMPYSHGQYPFAKLESIPTAKFYADSTLNDTNALQREYNEIRQGIRDAGRRMAKPQLLAERGSIVVSKLTNEPGSVIEFKPGRQAPTPLPISQLPQYYVEQQDRITGDLEDVSGQHQVSKGQAPAGLTAGSAITALQERDDQYLTTTYRALEAAYEKVGQQTIANFVQFVDTERQIKIVGADGAFDTLQLRGSDLSGSTDFRVESGSTVGQSKAAKQAYLMDMWQYGIIQDQQQMLKLLEVGGVQKILDTMNVAERQAQRENIKMKKADPAQAEMMQMQYQEQTQAFLQANEAADAGMAEPPTAAQFPELIGQDGQMIPQPSSIPVNDWDDHATHIKVHNTFRMTQEFEMLPQPIKDDFEAHVAAHTAKQQQAVMQQFLQQMPGDGTEESGPDGTPGEMNTAEDDQMAAEEEAAPDNPAATLAGNGAAPAPESAMEGQL